MKSKFYLPLLALIVMLAGASFVSAQSLDLSAGANLHTDEQNQTMGDKPDMPRDGEHRGMMNGMHQGILGTITAISGNSITITARQWKGATGTTVTYTIDATHARIDKNRAASTLSALAAGDTVMVQGTISGTSVVATAIHAGMMAKGNPGSENSLWNDPAVAAFTANGKPVVGGTVTAVTGNSITIANKSSQTYTIDAAQSSIAKSGLTTATVSNIAVGDSILVQGTFSGNSVLATAVLDQGAAPATPASTPGQPVKGHGFFSKIGSFFSHLFGF